MSFKTILVHQADDQGCPQRLEVAIRLARRFEAHLHLVYLTAPITTPVGIRGRGASLAYITEATEAGRKHARDVEKVVRERCQGNVPSWEWRVEEGELDKVIADHAHLSDLVIVSQAPLEHLEDRMILHLPAHLVMHIGCPMLLLPAKGQIDTMGRRIIVAWKRGRESLQALRNSLPFLQTAEKVTVLAASQDFRGQQAQDGIGAYLQRHGIHAEVIPIEDHLSGVGDIILRKAAEMGCDLVVMGAYGHSRVREIVLSGTTDFMMRHSTVPVLMAH